MEQKKDGFWSRVNGKRVIKIVLLVAVLLLAVKVVFNIKLYEADGMEPQKRIVYWLPMEGGPALATVQQIQDEFYQAYGQPHADTIIFETTIDGKKVSVHEMVEYTIFPVGRDWKLGGYLISCTGRGKRVAQVEGEPEIDMIVEADAEQFKRSAFTCYGWIDADGEKTELFADSFRVAEADAGYEEMMQMCKEAAAAAKAAKRAE